MDIQKIEFPNDIKTIDAMVGYLISLNKDNMYIICYTAGSKTYNIPAGYKLRNFSDVWDRAMLNGRETVVANYFLMNQYVPIRISD